MTGEENGQAKSKPKNKKLFIIAGAVVALILAAGAFFIFGNKSQKNSGGVVSDIVSSNLNANCKYNDADLCKFVNKWKDVKYLTVNSSGTSEGKNYTTVFKTEGGDKSQMIMSESGKESYNTITIGKTTYTKDYADNKWFKYTPTQTNESITKEESQIDFDKKEESADDKTTYEKMGTEACGQLTCFKYKVIDPANTDSTEYIFFDNKDYQLRKTRTEMKDGSVYEATYEFSEFSISEPSPTKEGNPYESALQGASTSQTLSNVNSNLSSALNSSSVTGGTSASSDDSGADSDSTDDSGSSE